MTTLEERAAIIEGALPQMNERLGRLGEAQETLRVELRAEISERLGRLEQSQETFRSEVRAEISERLGRLEQSQETFRSEVIGTKPGNIQV
jgi:hypothetical protein